MAAVATMALLALGPSVFHTREANVDFTRKGLFVAATPDASRIAYFAITATDEDVVGGVLKLDRTDNSEKSSGITMAMHGWPIGCWINNNTFAAAEEEGEQIWLLSVADGGSPKGIFHCEKGEAIGNFAPVPGGDLWALQILRYTHGLSEVRLMQLANGRLGPIGKENTILAEKVEYGRCGSFRAGMAWSSDGKLLAVKGIDSAIRVFEINIPPYSGPERQSKEGGLGTAKPIWTLLFKTPGAVDNVGINDSWHVDDMLIFDQTLLYQNGSSLIRYPLTGGAKATTMPIDGDVTCLANTSDGILLGIANKESDSTTTSRILFGWGGKGTSISAPIQGTIRWSNGKYYIVERGKGAATCFSMRQVQTTPARPKSAG